MQRTRVQAEKGIGMSGFIVAAIINAVVWLVAVWIVANAAIKIAEIIWS